MKTEKHISENIIRYFLNREKNEEDPVLTAWLDESESNRNMFCQYEKIWNESVHYMETTAFDADTAWEKLNRIHQQKEKSRRRLRSIYYTLSGAAASVLALLLLSFMGLFVKNDTTRIHAGTDYGNRSEIVLPDGSKVNLNSGTSIQYTYNTKKKVREVVFQGEGFFDVSKSKDPFVIKMTNDVEIKVLGTSFNLRAYQDDAEIQASLVEGSIEMKHDTNVIHLEAGEMAVYDKENGQLKPVDGFLPHSYGWLDNKLYMDNMSLADVCKYIERWYDVQISLEQKLGDDTHYNGVLREENVVDVMNALSRLSKIEYQVKGKHIRITSK